VCEAFFFLLYVVFCLFIFSSLSIKILLLLSVYGIIKELLITYRFIILGVNIDIWVLKISYPLIKLLFNFDEAVRLVLFLSLHL